MVEEPGRRWDSVSLLILLEDLKTHDDLLTRERFRLRYPRNLRERFADRDFDTITRRKRALRLTASGIQKDMARLRRAAQPVKRLVNKVVAHTELDRRRIGKATYEALDQAVDVIEATFRRYSLLLKGTYEQTFEVDIREDIEKIWP